MKKTTKVISSFLLLTLLLPALPALAATTNSNASITPNTPNPTGFCPSQSFLAPPPKPRLLILSISWTIKNDEDSGISGYWALDHVTTTLKVWALPGGNFYALKTYTGVFSVPQGAISPGTAVGLENESAFGTIQGGYVATFTGQFTPGSQPTSGKIGTFDYGGTLSDVLLQTYGNGQVGDKHAYDWTTAYFTNVQNFAQPHWGWAYLLNSNFFSTNSINQWCNYNTPDGGNSGDILVPA
jgi:hypothetical protein